MAKPPKLIKFDKRVRLQSAQNTGVKASIDGKEVELQDAVHELSIFPGAKKTEQGFTLTAPNAEEMMQELEEMGKRILIKHGYPDADCSGIDPETMTEEAYHAHELLFQLWQIRHWMQQTAIHLTAIEDLTRKTNVAAMCSGHVKNASLTASAAVREAINGMRQFVYIHNAVIGEDYEHGLANKKVLKKGRDTAVEKRKIKAAEKSETLKKAINDYIDYRHKQGIPDFPSHGAIFEHLQGQFVKKNENDKDRYTEETLERMIDDLVPKIKTERSKNKVI